MMHEYQLLAAANLICNHLAGTIRPHCILYHLVTLQARSRLEKNHVTVCIDKLLLQVGSRNPTAIFGACFYALQGRYARKPIGDQVLYLISAQYQPQIKQSLFRRVSYMNLKAKPRHLTWR